MFWQNRLSFETRPAWRKVNLRFKMSPDPEDFKQKRKRQRLTYTCTFCRKRKIKCDKEKPRCSNCIRFNRLCEYERPSWVNTSVEQDQVKTDVQSNKEHDYEAKSRTELYNEIEFWKAKATNEDSVGPSVSVDYQVQSSSVSSSGMLPPSVDLGSHYDDIVDFYENYDPLDLKRSSHEEQKPLNPIAIHKADHYMSFFLCYRFISLKITSGKLSKKMKETWKSKHSDGNSKWIALFDAAEDDVDLKRTIEQVGSDRAQLLKTNLFPILGVKDTDEQMLEFIKQEAEAVLPGKIVFTALLEHFFHNLWILRPYIDQDSFMQDVKRIIVFDNETLMPKVNITERHDLAVVSTLLIILRYTSITITITEGRHLSPSLQLLRTQIVSVKAISTAQLCLSVYKILKKTTLHVIQSLLFLRLYLKDCPEEGDGVTMGQSQMLFGFIVQSATTVGMNRDPFYNVSSSDVRTANTRRRIWHGLYSLDTQCSVLSGTLSALPPSQSMSVKYPVLTLGDPLERSQLDEMKKEMGLNLIHQKLCEAINNLRDKAKLHEIISLLDEARTYVDTTYSIGLLNPVTGLDKDSQLYRATVLKNHKSLEKQLLQISLEIMIYQFLYIRYESNKNLCVPIFKQLFKKCVQSLIAGLDLSGAYLTDKFLTYIDPAQSNVEIYPLLSSLSYRSTNFICGLLLRVFHAQELLTSQFGLATSTLGLQTYLDTLSKLICSVTDVQLDIFEKNIGVKYHLSLKVICASKFAFNSLKKHKFDVLNKLISFLETNDETKVTDLFNKSSKKNEVRKAFDMNENWFSVYTQWMQLSKAKNMGTTSLPQPNNDFNQLDLSDPIININHTNHLTSYSEQDVQELIDIVRNGFRYFATPANLNGGMYEGKEMKIKSQPTTDFDKLYDEFSQDPMFNAQMSNFVFQRGQTAEESQFDLLGNEFANDFLSPAIDSLVNFNDLVMKPSGI